jgi:hypothetical protein
MRRNLEALVASHDESLDPVVVDAAGRIAAHDAAATESDPQH